MILKKKLEVVNSSPGRSTNGVGSIHQQQTPNSSKFHLPELKPVINNNNNHDGANESQNVSTEEEISAYDRQQQQIEIAIAAAINGGSIVSPFRESDGASSSSFSSSNEEFLHRLVNAVRREPCLYNPNDEHYGNKHSSAQYRSSVWQKLCKELNYHEDAHSLQTQWKRLRERYVRERRRKAGRDVFDPLTGGVSSIKNFHLMHWIDEFLPDNNNQSSSNSSNNVSMQMPSTSISNQQQHQQYFEPLNNINGFGNIGICKSSLNGPTTSTLGKKNESTNGSPSSTSSETSIISGNGSGGGQQQQQMILPNLRHQIKSEINGGNSAFYSTGKANQLMYKLREELGLRMPPVIGLVNNIGQEQQHQQQHINSPHQLQMSTETLRPISAECYQQIGILPQQQQQHSIQDIQNDYFHQQPSASSSTNETISPYLNRRKRSALDSLMLLQQQSTNNERLLQQQRNVNRMQQTKQEQQQQIIGESEHLLLQQQQQQQQQIPSIALAIHNNQQQHIQHHLPSPHQAPSVHSVRSNSNSSTIQQNNLNNNLNINFLPSTSSTVTIASTSNLPQQQQQIFQQEINNNVENEEGNFIEMIVRHLKNLNEDEKVVTKMNIQRILMDARFGRGACVRMFNDELAMEQQRQQQHLQQQTKFGE
uniref:MADF domain-containing protein n=1 Tax=Meloidogyne hapla TaxID=6305 RepID=A0A1I8B4K9_MELHA